MNAFQIGQTYGVFRLDDATETVTIVARTPKTVTLSDGRVQKIVIGLAPRGAGYEEVIRLNEVGPVAAGVVRACHFRAA